MEHRYRCPKCSGKWVAPFGWVPPHLLVCQLCVYKKGTQVVPVPLVAHINTTYVAAHVSRVTPIHLRSADDWA